MVKVVIMSPDYIGYFASAIIIISLLMNDFVRFRSVNIIGCAIWVYYGATINSSPVIIFNSACIGVNLYYFLKVKILTKKEKLN